MFTKRTTKLLAGAGIGLLVAVAALSLFVGQASQTSKVAAAAPALGPNDCQNFGETGFNVCGRFLEYWRSTGGVAAYGFPLSEVFDELNQPPPAGDGKIHKVQYFQRTRFEEHLENTPPYDVLLGLLGAEQYKVKYGSTDVMTLRGKRIETKIGDFSPRPNYTFLVLDLLFTNTTTKKILISPNSIILRTAQVYDYQVAQATYSLPKFLKLTELGLKETVGGELVYEIPNNETPKSVTVDYFIGKSTIAL